MQCCAPLLSLISAPIVPWGWFGCSPGKSLGNVTKVHRNHFSPLLSFFLLLTNQVLFLNLCFHPDISKKVPKLVFFLSYRGVWGLQHTFKSSLQPLVFKHFIGIVMQLMLRIVMHSALITLVLYLVLELLGKFKEGKIWFFLLLTFSLPWERARPAWVPCQCSPRGRLAGILAQGSVAWWVSQPRTWWVSLPVTWLVFWFLTLWVCRPFTLWISWLVSPTIS